MSRLWQWLLFRQGLIGMGTVSFTFEDCNTGTMTYSANDAAIGYGRFSRLDGARAKPMKDPTIGTPHKLDKGKGPGIAMNQQGAVLEAHQAEAGFNLWYRLGQWDGGEIRWGRGHHFNQGDYPVLLAVNDHGLALEMHRSNSVTDNTFMYHVGELGAQDLFSGESKGSELMHVSSVAMNHDGVVILTRRHDGKSFHIGRIDSQDSSIIWGEPIKFGSTSEASTVSVNDHGYLVISYRSTIRFGKLNSQKDDIDWLLRLDLEDCSEAGAVAMNDDGYAVLPVSDAKKHYLIAIRFYYQSKLKKWLADRSSKTVYKSRGGGLMHPAIGISLTIADQNLALVEYKSDHPNDGNVYCATGSLV